ncbi:PilW family protein [Bacillus sp. DJP31]|uniref:PilW family protein n=1 Tax=Bacillus sp. DJP31 TaxID=3409789 RepID=UPI003BB72265
MSHFKKIHSVWKSQRGISLVELLVALAISTVIMTSIYGVYSIGVNAYKMIGVEGHIRDEADYVVTRIMNSIYELSPDTIEPCKNALGTQISNCYNFINDNQLVVSRSNNQLVEQKQKGQTDITINELKLENGHVLLNNENLNALSISITDGEESNLTDNSYISFTCTNLETVLGTGDNRCINGTFDIQLTLENLDYGPTNPLHVKPLTLTSKFGY